MIFQMHCNTVNVNHFIALWNHFHFSFFFLYCFCFFQIEISVCVCVWEREFIKNTHNFISYNGSWHKKKISLCFSSSPTSSFYLQYARFMCTRPSTASVGNRNFSSYYFYYISNALDLSWRIHRQSKIL